MEEGMLNRRTRRKLSALAPQLRAIKELAIVNPTAAEMARQDLFATPGGRRYGAGERTVHSLAADIRSKSDGKKRPPIEQTPEYSKHVHARATRWIRNGYDGRAPGHIQKKLLQFAQEDKKGFTLAVERRLAPFNIKEALG